MSLGEMANSLIFFFSFPVRLFEAESFGKHLQRPGTFHSLPSRPFFFFLFSHTLFISGLSYATRRRFFSSARVHFQRGRDGASEPAPLAVFSVDFPSCSRNGAREQRGRVREEAGQTDRTRCPVVKKCPSLSLSLSSPRSLANVAGREGRREERRRRAVEGWRERASGH